MTFHPPNTRIYLILTFSYSFRSRYQECDLEFFHSSHSKDAGERVGVVVKKQSHREHNPDFMTFMTEMLGPANIILPKMLESHITEAISFIPKTFKTIPETAKIQENKWCEEKPTWLKTVKLHKMSFTIYVRSISNCQRLLRISWLIWNVIFGSLEWN